MVTGRGSQRKCHAPYSAPFSAVQTFPNWKLLSVAGGKPVGGDVLMPAYSRKRNFEVGVGVAPKERETGKPVLSVDRLAGAGKLFRPQKTDGRGEFRADDFSAHGAGGNLNLRVVVDALALSQFTVGHEVEFVVVFGKPDGGVHGDAALSEGSQADVTLAVDFSGDGSHADIVKRCEEFLRRMHTDITLNFRVDCFWPMAHLGAYNGAYNSELSRLRI